MPKCSTPMNLARVAPDEEGIEDRIFKCPNCRNIERRVFKSKGTQFQSEHCCSGNSCLIADFPHGRIPRAERIEYVHR